jgi:hypothetical protein
LLIARPNLARIYAALSRVAGPSTISGPDDVESGVYLLDLETLRADRIGDLEAA